MTEPTTRDDAVDPIRDLALACAHAAIEKKAADVALLDLRQLTSLADWFVIASARSDTQVRAIAEEIERVCRERDRRPLAVEGVRHGQWVLIDYGDVVVHVFYGPVREFYDLERLWARAPRVAIDDAGELRPAAEHEREAAR